jgi:hypothetical protein
MGLGPIRFVLDGPCHTFDCQIYSYNAPLPVLFFNKMLKLPMQRSGPGLIRPKISPRRPTLPS